MEEYRIDSVLVKARACGLSDEKTDSEKESEIELHIRAYWWFGDYYTKHNARPPHGEVGAGIGYMDGKFREAYKMSEIRLQRIIDEWHEER